MTSPESQESGPFREWAPLATLLQKIPAKIQLGLFFQDINFTCIDAVAEFIAVGTNHGHVYWYDRKSGKLETLGCENANGSITCVKIVSTVDYMVAAGDNHGVVTIFQIPKQVPDSLPEILKPKKKKQVERFNVSDLHKAPVTAVEWSKNGMKLFSGDQDGLVVLTEMDFNLHLSKSTELLNEKYSVVQLSYQSGILLISTLFRTIIVDQNQNNQVTQVGQKERKMLGKLGAVFSKSKNPTQGPIIYASRQGLRIWEADKDGVVLKTLIFKDAVRIVQSRVELLNPASESIRRKSRGDPIFGIILPFSDDLLVTYNEDTIYIVNPNTITVTSVVTDLRRITDVACSDDEIFILEGERSILRIASHPEVIDLDAVPVEPVDYLAALAESSKSITWGLTELTSKIKSNSIIPAIPFPKLKPPDFIQSTSILPPIVTGIDTTSIINAEEAIEVPPIVPLELDTTLVTGTEMLMSQSQDCLASGIQQPDRKDIFQKIAEQDFEEVVFTPKRKDKKLPKKTKKLEEQKMSENSVVCDNRANQDNRMNSIVESTNLSPSIQGIDDGFVLNSGRNLEIIQKAVQDKEKLLSNYLSLDLSKYLDKSRVRNTKSNHINLTENNGYTNNLLKPWTINPDQCEQTLDQSESDQARDDVKSESIKLTNPTEYHLKASKTERNEVESISQVDQQPQEKRSDLEDKKRSEINFNALSKEFVKSTIFQDNDDWILLG